MMFRSKIIGFVRENLIESFPEIEQYGETTQYTAILIVIDVLLLPVYMGSPTIYLLSILMHIYLAGGFTNVLNFIIDRVQRLFDKVEDDAQNGVKNESK